MAISGIGVGMTAAGALLAYAAFTDQPIPDALRNVLKGTPLPVRNTPATWQQSGTIGNVTSGGTSELAQAATKYVGRPYQWAKNFDPPNGGGDCSGLVYRAFHDLGYTTPRLSSYGYLTWKGARKTTSVKAGDLLWWSGHVAIAVDNAHMVEAPTFGVPVRVASIRPGAVPLTPDWAYLQTRYIPQNRSRGPV